MYNWLHEAPFYLMNQQWLALVGLLVLSPIFSKIITSFILKSVLSRGRRFLQINKKDQGRLNIALRLMFIFAMGYWVYPYLDFEEDLLKKLQLYTSKLFFIALFFGIYAFINILAQHFEKLAGKTDNKFDDVLVPMLAKASKVLLWAIFLVYLANTFNIDVTSVVAGLGIGGLAFAFAAKDTLANLFGSVMIILDKPFEIGDYIIVEDKEGSVEEVGFRSTRVRTFYDSVVTIPNSVLSNKYIDNLGKRRYRRFKGTFGIEYGTPTDKIESFVEGIREIIRSHPKTRKDNFNIYFNGLGSSSLDILIYMFWEVRDWTEELEEKQKFLIDVMKLAEKMDVSFAFPTQTLHTFNHIPPEASV